MRAILLIALVALVAAGLYFFVDIRMTQEGQLPQVSITGGQLPEFEVETGSVNIGRETTTVTVPDVDVTTETKEVEVPKVTVTPAE